MRFELFESHGGRKWDFRLRHGNGAVLLSSSQGYENRQDAVDAINSVRQGAGGARLILVPHDGPNPKTGVDMDRPGSYDPGPIPTKDEVVERAMDAAPAEKTGDIEPLESKAKDGGKNPDYVNDKSRDSRPAKKTTKKVK